MRNKVYLAENLNFLRKMPSESVDLVYIDPPFNTGRVQARQNVKMTRVDGDGERSGFQDERYVTTDVGVKMSYHDSFDSDTYLSLIRTRLSHLHRVLKPTGSLYLHLDYREVHYAKVVGDQIFGRSNFLNEIIWAYDYGAKPKTRWPAKHENILLWAKQKGQHVFNVDDIDREPYMAPGMAGPEKAAKGKLPNDCWWHTIVSPTGKEKTGYPTQKPIGILKRIVRASSPSGGLVLDVFAGSGTTGEACLLLGRQFILVDSNPQAVKVMRKRFATYIAEGHKIGFLNRLNPDATEAKEPV